EEAASQILQPRQTRRLEQIAFQIQQQGPTGFRDPRVVAALQLTAQQKEAIRKLQEEAWVGMGPFPPEPGAGAGPRPGPGVSRQRVFGRPEFSGEQLQEKILALLTPHQKSLWKELAGEPFSGWRPPPPPGGFMMPFPPRGGPEF